MNTENMTLIISGTRTINDYTVVRDLIEDSGLMDKVATVYFGDARGVDAHALEWCKKNGITYRRFKAYWNLYGLSAGPERNGDMVRSEADALLLIWDGESKGSKDMKKQAKRAGLPIYESIVTIEVDDEED